MRWNHLDDVESTLDAAIGGRLCTQAWLGVGNVLFLGFGEDVLPATLPGESHPEREYELQLDSADWWIEDASGVRAASTDGRTAAQLGATLLVGRRVAGWYSKDSIAALEIDFEDGLTLKMSPYTDADVSEMDAWILRVPIYYGYVKWNGTFGTGRRDHYFLEDDVSSPGCPDPGP